MEQEQTLDLDRKIIMDEHLLDEAREVARADGQIETFRRIEKRPMEICPKGGTVRCFRDSSLPKHSVLTVMVKADGRHHRTLGIVRHVYSDGRICWATAS